MGWPSVVSRVLADVSIVVKDITVMAFPAVVYAVVPGV